MKVGDSFDGMHLSKCDSPLHFQDAVDLIQILFHLDVLALAEQHCRDKRICKHFLIRRFHLRLQYWLFFCVQLEPKVARLDVAPAPGSSHGEDLTVMAVGAFIIPTHPVFGVPTHPDTVASKCHWSGLGELVRRRAGSIGAEQLRIFVATAAGRVAVDVVGGVVGKGDGVTNCDVKVVVADFVACDGTNPVDRVIVPSTST